MDSYALTLLKRFTYRDTQTKVGPSDIADPCDLCLAEKLLRFLHKDDTPREWGKWWLAARIGTAIHETAERSAEDIDFFESESKVKVHHMDNYGWITGTCDLMDLSTDTLVDLKTTDREKLKKYKQAQRFQDSRNVPSTVQQALYTWNKYKGQTHLYALGKENEGTKVTSIVISFICRDGKTDADIWDTDPIPYERDYALALIARLEAIWEAVQKHENLEPFTSHSLCFTCSKER